MLARFVCACFCLGGVLFAQTPQPAMQPAIAGASYIPPAPIPVAPGQIVTLYLQGVGTNLPDSLSAKSGVALPEMLGGISVNLAGTGQSGNTAPIPVLKVQSVNTCSPSQPGFAGFLLPPPSTVNCGSVIALTVQIPYSLAVYTPQCGQAGVSDASCGPAFLTVTYEGATGPATALTVLPDEVHIFTDCDLMLARALIYDPLSPPIPDPTPHCWPQVTHADGTLVSSSSPAKSGEALVAWVTGLGTVNPGITEGQTAIIAMPTTQTFHAAHNFTPNALGNKPGPNATAVLYSGLVAGYVGLYQINFTVPSVPAGTTPCAQPGTYAAGANVVQSNLTVSFGGNFSFDGAGICVTN